MNRATKKWLRPSTNKRFIDAARRYVGNVNSVAEVAACVPKECWVAPYCRFAHVRVLLVEPLPENAQMLRAAFGRHANVRIEEVAIQAQEGPVQMWRRLGVSANGVTDVAKNWDLTRPEWQSVMVRGVPFSTIDPGDINAMLVDVEGCEHIVLQTMTSRPKMIFVEVRQPTVVKGEPTHYKPPPSVPHTRAWMEHEGYEKVGECFLDDIYVRS